MDLRELNTQSAINRINIRFAALQGTFWASLAPIFAYAVIYLQFQGLTNTQVGITIAAGSLFAIIIQAVISHFTDKKPDSSLKNIISVLFFICMAANVVLMLRPGYNAFLMITYTVGLASANSIYSFTTALFLRYKKAGFNVNFGIPRAIGSLFFALTSFGLGYFIEIYSPEILPPVCITFCAIGILATISLPYQNTIDRQTAEKTARKPKVSSTWSMIRDNPTFVLLCLSAILIFFGQTHTLFYINIIKDVGGHTTHLGLILFIAVLSELPGMMLSKKMMAKYKSKDLVVVSIFGFLIKTIIVALAPNIFWIIISALCNLFASGIYFFSTLYFVDEIVKPDQITRGQAFFGLCSLGGIGTVLGTLFNGMIIDRFGISALLVFCTAISAVGFALVLLARRVHAKKCAA